MPPSPYINQFLSADTIVPDPTNPQDLNRFSYVRNNPLKYTDPSGHACVEGTSYCVNSATGQTSGNLSGWTGIGDAAPLSQSQYCNRYPWACGGSGNRDDSEGSSPLGSNPSYTGDRTACGQAGYYSAHCPGWHFYRTTNVVCPAYLHCTEAQMQDYLHRFAYPGQNPNNPVRNDARNLVLVNGIVPLGLIQTQVDGLVITNVTQPLHLMHDGQVERRAIQNSDGSWSVVTTGMGNNVQIPFVPEGPSGFDYSQMTYIDFALINQDLGPGAFMDLDKAMLNYIIANQ